MFEVLSHYNQPVGQLVFPSRPQFLGITPLKSVACCAKSGVKNPLQSACDARSSLLAFTVK